MDIQELLKLRDSLTAQMMNAGGQSPDPLVLNRPAELQQAQAARLKQRIAALEQEKISQADQIDSEIKDLQGQLDGLEQGAQTNLGKLPAVATASPKSKASRK